MRKELRRQLDVNEGYAERGVAKLVQYRKVRAYGANQSVSNEVAPRRPHDKGVEYAVFAPHEGEKANGKDKKG
jgi:hypothetical protein